VASFLVSVVIMIAVVGTLSGWMLRRQRQEMGRSADARDHR
jgi:putative effector of murein hydrolase LrgA (UPF0299 family)